MNWNISNCVALLFILVSMSALAEPLATAIPCGTGGKFDPRNYQHNAIEKTLTAIAGGKDIILLTLATGMGKTAIAF